MFCLHKRVLDLRVSDSCKLLCECWELNPGPLKKQPVLWIAELVLYLLVLFFGKILVLVTGYLKICQSYAWFRIHLIFMAFLCVDILVHMWMCVLWHGHDGQTTVGEERLVLFFYQVCPEDQTRITHLLAGALTYEPSFQSRIHLRLYTVVYTGTVE